MTAIPQQINFWILPPPTSNIILPYISLHLIRVTGHSLTFVDDIYSNHISKESICGNLTSMISDHLPRFLIISSIFLDPSSSKSNVYERSWSNFNKEEFTLDYFEKGWGYILNVEKIMSIIPLAIFF